MSPDPLETISRLSAREKARIATAVRDAVGALDAIGAPHALVGGVAVGLRSGIPRATLDTNLAVRSTADRPRVVAALVEAGFSRTGEFPHSTNFRHASGEPVQLVFDPGFDASIDPRSRWSSRVSASAS